MNRYRPRAPIEREMPRAVGTGIYLLGKGGVGGRPNEISLYEVVRWPDAWKLVQPVKRPERTPSAKIPTVELPARTQNLGQLTPQCARREHFTALLNSNTLTEDQIALLTAAILRGEVE